MEVWTKNIPLRLIEGQSHLGMPKKCYQMTLDLKQPIIAFHSNSSMGHKWKRIIGM